MAAILLEMAVAAGVLEAPAAAEEAMRVAMAATRATRGEPLLQ